MSVATLAHHGVPAVGHHTWLVREKLPLPSRLQHGALGPVLGRQQVDPLLVVDAHLLNNIGVSLHAIEPQYVVGRECVAAAQPCVCPPDLEPHYQEVVIVHAIPVSAPRRAAP